MNDTFIKITIFSAICSMVPVFAHYKLKMNNPRNGIKYISYSIFCFSRSAIQNINNIFPPPLSNKPIRIEHWPLNALLLGGHGIGLDMQDPCIQYIFRIHKKSGWIHPDTILTYVSNKLRISASHWCQ